MRKVLFKTWIPAEFSKSGKVPNTGCWSKDYIGTGLFHQWGNSCTESEEGFGNFTVALVELPDGTITEVFPCNIKFIEPANE